MRTELGIFIHLMKEYIPMTEIRVTRGERKIVVAWFCLGPLDRIKA